MPRLFLGLDLPDILDQQIALMYGGLPGARWESASKLHLTVSFIGDVDGGVARAIVDALTRLDAPRQTVTLAGVGVFPPRGQPRVLWLGVEQRAPLVELKRRVDALLETVPGVDVERRKYTPHVTIARLKRTPERRLAEWIGGHSLFRSPPFEVDAVRLYSSVLSSYRVEAAFRLR